MSGWTEDRIKECVRLWEAGHSAAIIARRLGETTRNAVIGKLHRLGHRAARSPDRVVKYQLPRRKMPLKSASQPKLTRRARVAALHHDLTCLPLPEAVEERFVPLDQRKGVLEVEPNDCRWPIGDPRNKDFHFCCQPKTAGLPYCEAHARRAYAPPQAFVRPYMAGAPYVTAGPDDLPDIPVTKAA